MKVLIIPEDQTLDGFIAKPVIEAIFNDLDINATVDVLPEPRLRGAGDALDPNTLQFIIESNPMIDRFILVVDKDCDRNGHVAKASDREQEHDRLLICIAVQEIEVWMLALYKDRLDARWPQVREHCDPKERWAEPLLNQLGKSGPGNGRKKAMRALKGNLTSLLSLCNELQELRDKIDVSRSAALT